MGRIDKGLKINIGTFLRIYTHFKLGWNREECTIPLWLTSRLTLFVQIKVSACFLWAGRWRQLSQVTRWCNYSGNDIKTWCLLSTLSYKMTSRWRDASVVDCTISYLLLPFKTSSLLKSSSLPHIHPLVSKLDETNLFLTVPVSQRDTERVPVSVWDLRTSYPVHF